MPKGHVKRELICSCARGAVAVEVSSAFEKRMTNAEIILAD